MLPLPAVCTVEVVQFLNKPLLVEQRTGAAVPLFNELPEAQSLSDTKQTGEKDKKCSFTQKKTTHFKSHVDNTHTKKVILETA